MDKRREELAQKVARYIEKADLAADPTVLDELEDHISKSPEWAQPSTILPVEEMEERLRLIRKLERDWEEMFCELTKKKQQDFVPFGNYQMASLMTMDLDRLRQATDSELFCKAVLNAAWKIPALLKMCTLSPSWSH